MLILGDVYTWCGFCWSTIPFIPLFPQHDFCLYAMVFTFADEGTELKDVMKSNVKVSSWMY
jgi:hypothetical protein